MNKTLTIKDYELISAYLDSACSPQEKAKIEARLQSDAEFKQVLAEFKRAKWMISQVPKKRAPRNFTLSASQVPQPARRSAWVPALNFVALAASMMLVVVFVGSRFLGFGVNKMAIPEAVPMMAAAPANSDSQSATLSPIITWGQVGGYGGGGGDAGGFATGMGGGPTTDTFSAEVAPEAPVEQPAETNPDLTPKSPQATEAVSADTASGLILGLAPEEERGNQITAKEAVSSEPAAAPFPWLLASQIALALLAIGSVVLSLILRRRP